MPEDPILSGRVPTGARPRARAVRESQSLPRSLPAHPAHSARQRSRCLCPSHPARRSTERGISKSGRAGRADGSGRGLRSPAAGHECVAHPTHRGIRVRKKSARAHFHHSPAGFDETLPTNDVLLILGAARAVLVAVILHHRAELGVHKVGTPEPSPRVIPHVAVRQRLEQFRPLQQEAQQGFGLRLGSTPRQIESGCRAPRSSSVEFPYRQSLPAVVQPERATRGPASGAVEHVEASAHAGPREGRSPRSIHTLTAPAHPHRRSASPVVLQLPVSVASAGRRAIDSPLVQLIPQRNR